jgi:hypothetical protein
VTLAQETLKERIAAIPMAEKRAICKGLLWNYAKKLGLHNTKPKALSDFFRRQEEKWDEDPSIVDEFMEENTHLIR